MSISIVRLGSHRRRGEGLRIGTVRRPPRGVRISQYAKRDLFDVWLPTLAPSAALMRKNSVREDGAGWVTFERRYRAEMKGRDASRVLNVLAALSRQTNFSVGCYCENERRCHRSILRSILRERRAVLKRNT
jgi:uncharacterized protein YeaO (DUF488 family)